MNIDIPYKIGLNYYCVELALYKLLWILMADDGLKFAEAFKGSRFYQTIVSAVGAWQASQHVNF
jgi:hypothetical protein